MPGSRTTGDASCNRCQSVKKWLLFQKNLKRSVAPLTGMRESCKLARVYNEKKRVLFPPCDDGGLKQVLRLATYCLEAFVVIDRGTQIFKASLCHETPLPSGGETKVSRMSGGHSCRRTGARDFRAPRREYRGEGNLKLTAEYPPHPLPSRGQALSFPRREKGHYF